jgi:hypothetical protein
MSFLEDKIITRFGSPSNITTDDEKEFWFHIFVNLLLQLWNCLIPFNQLLPAKKWLSKVKQQELNEYHQEGGQ